mgnify:CR=1 FL=1
MIGLALGASEDGIRKCKCKDKDKAGSRRVDTSVMNVTRFHSTVSSRQKDLDHLKI